MARTPRREDEDEEDSDRPRKKRKRRAKESGGSGKIIAVGVVGAILLTAGVLVGVLLTRGKKDETAAKVDADTSKPSEGTPPPKTDPALTPEKKITVYGPRGGTAPKQPSQAEPPKSQSPPPVLLKTASNDIRQVILAGGATGSGAAITRGEGTLNNIDVFETATGKPIGRGAFDDKSADGHSLALSPDGKTIAIEHESLLRGSTIILSSVAEGKPIRSFLPYPVSGLESPRFAWMALPAADRFITVNSSGGFDIWSGPTFKRTGGGRGTVPIGEAIISEVDTNIGYNVAITQDGTRLAIYNGQGFTIHDAITGEVVTRTGPVSGLKTGIMFRGAAFTPDGKRLATAYQSGIETGRNTHMLTIWNLDDPTRSKHSLVQGSIVLPGGIAWWGADHLLFWGGDDSANVIDTNGAFPTRLRVTRPGEFVKSAPDGDVWAVSRGYQNKVLAETLSLVRSDSKFEPAVRNFELGLSGFRRW